MAAPSKADYLKKYLSENAEEKKKKKRKKLAGAPAKVIKSRIVDDDVDFKSLLPSNLSNTLEEDVGDNDPMVADVIDERPEHMKKGTLLIDKGNIDMIQTRILHHPDTDDMIQTQTQTHHHPGVKDMIQKSPPRRSKQSSNTQSRDRHNSESDYSPPRRKRHDSGSDSDPSQPRKKQNKSTADRQSHRRKRHNSDSDPSPPRRQRNDSDSDQSPPRKQKRHGSDSDQSPPRKQRHNSDSDQSPPRRKRNFSDSDQSPPRSKGSRQSSKQKAVQDITGKRKKHRHNSDSDNSPPRKGKEKTEKTLSGKKAGLSSAKEMRREADELKMLEDEKFRQIDDGRLGRGAATVFRDKKSGRAEKPMARYRDDEDLDQMLREMDRAEDPMLAFMKKKKNKNAPAVKEKPKYKGPAPLPNRFGIMPGYRWDGVDRSNGFEKQVFAKQAEGKAQTDMAYKWSVEDM
ncbi:LOW QUALITY PROTEIN: BUD13-like protein [Mya arenaria]|uniref:BUD13 homolog n=1 Tax=Mya arenaria TaxID=6604 RepID=A0ABY7E5K9_MYAAR|nr:LOW QUALITY PROTEIN: BUD13-like protein [Mya arenaria]